MAAAYLTTLALGHASMSLPPPRGMHGKPIECVEKKGSKWCSKKLNKCKKTSIAAKCELACGVCGVAGSPPPPPPACDYVDKKGTEWCAKKATNAKKLSKLCSSGKAKKCAATCGC